MARKKCRRMGRRGNFIFDNLALIFIIFALGILMVGAYFIYGRLNSVMQGMTFIPEEVRATADSMDDYRYWDFLFLFIFVAFVLALWFSVWVIDTHPIFFYVFALVMVVFTLLCMMMGNAFQDLMRNNALGVADFVIIPAFMNNFVIIMVVVGFVTGFLLFAKTRTGGI